MMNKKNSAFILSVGIMISIGRFHLRNSADISYIMGLVNIFALNYVLYVLLAEIKNNTFVQLDKWSVSRDVINKKKKFIKKLISVAMSLCFLVLPISYLIFINKCDDVLCNSGNDILAIMSLCLSIETERLSESIPKFIVRKMKIK